MFEVYDEIKKACGNQADLVVVSKKRSLEEMIRYYDHGVRLFGENRAQDMIEKANSLPKDIEWQFIGHLQRNKVRSILPYVSRIHSVESRDLLKVIEKEAALIDRTINILIQFNLAEEETKTGLSLLEAESFAEEALSYSHINVEGIMCMGPHVENEEAIDACFKQAHELLIHLQNRFGEDHFHVLSMGMSSDWKIALKNGSTCLRIGTILFE